MSFVTPLLLTGAALIAVPIVLHLIMRQQPKHLIFPALRFVKQREQVNRRKLRLRQILLLALRCAGIVLLAFALARPSIQASGLMADQEAPVAAAMVFDTSPRMQYRHENKTRLEAAQEVGAWLLPQLPAESQVAVIDLGRVPPVFALDVGAARQRIERLKETPAAQPLVTALTDALRLLGESDKLRKEVYIYTDLAQAGWPKHEAAALQKRLAELADIAVYVIDVGVPEPRNFSLGDLRLSNDTMATNVPLEVETELRHVGPDEERTVGLNIVENGQLRMRAQQVVSPGAGESRPLRFQLSGLPEGTTQGYVKISGADGLAADDIRYFTVEARPPWRILLAAPKPAAPNAQILKQALAPESFRKSRFRCDVVALDALAAHDLRPYAAVCLIDPAPLETNTWEKLHEYVQRGGGLAIWLGRYAQPIEKFNSPAALKLLPGPLKRIWSNQDAYLAPEHLEHPVLAKFRPLENVPWRDYGVYKFWQLAGTDPGVNVIIPYSNGKPALLEKAVGRGRVLTMTTGVTDSASDPNAWNVLLTGFSPWPFFTVSNEMMAYLVGTQRLNYEAGEMVVLHVDTLSGGTVFTLTTPLGHAIQQSADQRQGTLAITTTDVPGNYTVAAGGEQGIQRGFSVNLTAESCRLERLDEKELAAFFGEAKYRLARSREEIDRDISLGRVGRELFPYLIFLATLVLAAEYVLATRFYKRPPGQSIESKTAVRAAEEHRSMAMAGSKQ